MCGIFGLLVPAQTEFDGSQLRRTLDRLFRFSESRGKEAAGLALRTEDRIEVFKRNIPASRFLRQHGYRQLFRGDRIQPHAPLAAIGHSRLVTNGSEEVHRNNQPVIVDGAVGIHNGIIVNAEALWQRFGDLERRSEVDSEVLFRLLRHFISQGQSLTEATGSTFEHTQGQASIAALFSDMERLLLFTNNGSLFVATHPQDEIFLFASERHILDQMARKCPALWRFGPLEIRQVQPGDGMVVEIGCLRRHDLTRDPARQSETIETFDHPPLAIVDLVDRAPTDGPTGDTRKGRRSPEIRRVSVPADLEDAFERYHGAIAQLRRCQRCLLPDTMPFLVFDQDGICNFCHGYRANEIRPRQELEALLQPLRRQRGNGANCLLGLSGGRDSSYALHVLVEELDMRPVTFTYDWGMVTDLARRNVSRLVGALGIEHILVSADIKRKRANIRKNVAAWLEKPDLGIIPLFMAGDKQYFYHANRIKAQLGVGQTFLGENLLERTDFKTGYCGIPPVREDEDRVYVLNAGSQARMLSYYGQQYLSHPRYLNASLLDTAFAYASYYLIDRDYINLYRYIPWEEEVLERTLLDGYDWETANDTGSTWRIGDGTAAFYNYIYYTVGGFSENDTFRSNQIREGKISRRAAMEKIRLENRPRWETMQWYCDTIGIDFLRAVRRINQIPRRYPW